VGHRGSFLILIALLGGSLLGFGQLRLLPIYQQRLVRKRLLRRQMKMEIKLQICIRLLFHARSRLFFTTETSAHFR